MCSLATFSPFLLEKARRNGLWSTNRHGNRYINARKASHFGAHAQPKFLHGHECKSIGRQKWNILTAQTIPPVRLSQPSQPFLTVPAIPAVPPTRTIQTTPKQIPNRGPVTQICDTSLMLIRTSKTGPLTLISAAILLSMSMFPLLHEAWRSRFCPWDHLDSPTSGPPGAIYRPPSLPQSVGRRRDRRCPRLGPRKAAPPEICVEDGDVNKLCKVCSSNVSWCGLP